MPERIHRWLDSEARSEDAKSAGGATTQRRDLQKTQIKKSRRNDPEAERRNGDHEVADTSNFQASESQSNPTFPEPISLPSKGENTAVIATQQDPDLSETRHASISTRPTAAKSTLISLRDRAKALWLIRKNLPIWSHSLEIRTSLREKDVLLVVGETGSGKSTQIPQILLHETWCRPQYQSISTKFGTQNVRVGGRIAVTEPRRVAAISLARRVAEEIGSPLGSSSPASLVGYSVRFDTSTSPSTRIKFLTEGMLLQEILKDPVLREYSAIVVDEVHERGVNVDLVLGFLRRMLERPGEGRGGSRLKVCVMSATAEMEQLRRFFEEESEAGEETPTTGVEKKFVTGESALGTSKHSMIDRTTNNGRDIPTPKHNIENAQPKAMNDAGKDEYEEDPEWSGISSSDHDEDFQQMPATHNVQNIQTQAENSRDEVEDENWSGWSGISASDDEGVRKTPAQEILSSRRPVKRSIEIAEASLCDLQKPLNGSHNREIGPKGSNSNLDGKQSLPQVSVCHIEGRQFPVKINYFPEPVLDIVEASLKTVFQIHYKEPLPGDILVFLTGQETVETLELLVKDYSLGMDPKLPKLLVLPLFAALPQAAQQHVFQPTPPGTRKIIISTNIAETSVTVPGVHFVIDCGKAKIKQYRTRIGLESLLVKPISKSAAIQRKGRAGREAPGQCYRLYTEKDYLALDESNTPEILRCDLSHPVLTMRARGVEDVMRFPFLDQPPREAMEKALLQLWMLGALSDSGVVTGVGLKIARFPLSVSLGRALIAAAEPEADCVVELVDIIACLSVENVFLSLNSEEKREQAETARRELYRREGDHLTMLATVQAYAAEGTDRKAWADRHFVSHRAMRAVMDVRKQLRAQCKQMGILSTEAIADGDASTSAISPEANIAILRSLIKGFAMNTAALCPDGSYKTFVGQQTVAIHPSSVLFGRKVEAIIFNEFVFTKKSYARGVSAVQLDWVGERFSID